MTTASIFVLGSFVIACSAKVSRFPRAGESLRAENVTVEPGGKGFNLALGARRLEVDVDGLLAVGDDLLSVFAPPALEKAGLPAGMLTLFPGRTGSGIGFTDGSGENCLAVDPGANLRLAAEHVHAASDQLGRAGLILAQFEIGDEPILAAFRLARAAQKHTMLNPSPFRPILPEIMAQTSILIVNAAEAGSLADSLGLRLQTGFDALAEHQPLAEAVLSHGPETLIVTLGAAGAAGYRKDGPSVFQPAFVVDPVDTLGAGDAFAAGLAAHLAKGMTFENALRHAAACGALATLGLGVFEHLPTLAELERFLSRYPA